MKVLNVCLLATGLCASVSNAINPPKAAGILAYTYQQDGNPYFLLGYDPLKVQMTGAWTDSGGLIDKGETPLEAAYREFAEETRGVFGNVDPLNPAIGNYVSDNMLKKSITYAQDHANLLPLMSPGNPPPYYEYTAFVDYIPEKILEKSAPHVDKNNPGGTDVIPFFLWISAHTLIDLIESGEEYPVLSAKLLQEKVPTFIPSMKKTFDKPTVKLYGDFVKTLRNKNEKGEKNIQTIADIVLSPFVELLTYTYNADGTTDILFEQQQDGSLSIFRAGVTLTKILTLKDALLSKLTEAQKKGITLDNGFVIAPPHELAAYTAQLKSGIFFSGKTETVDARNFLAWIQQKDSSQKVATRLGKKIGIDSLVHRTFSTPQGVQKITDILTNNPHDPAKKIVITIPSTLEQSLQNLTQSLNALKGALV